MLKGKSPRQRAPKSKAKAKIKGENHFDYRNQCADFKDLYKKAKAKDKG